MLEVELEAELAVDLEEVVGDEPKKEGEPAAEEESEAFVVSDVDDTDEPVQQVMVAGATADPVKDYLKQIGKVPLLNAERRSSSPSGSRPACSRRRSSPGGKMSAKAPRTTSSGSPRTAAAPRTTCSRPTCASSSRSPSATPAAACSSWT